MYKKRNMQLICIILIVTMGFITGCSNTSPSTTATTQVQTTSPSTTAITEVQTISKVDLVFGGGAMGGVYFTIGGAMKSILEEKVPEINNVNVKVGSSSQFAFECQEGKVDLFLNTIDALYFAWSGAGRQGFKVDEKFDKLRLIAIGYTHIFDFVTLENSPMMTVKDIGEQKIGCPSPTMVGPIEDILKAHGIPNPNVVMISDYNQMNQALKDGTLSAFVVAGPQPMPSLVELATTTPVKLLTLDNAAVEDALKNGKESSFMQKMVVPAGAYTWLKEDYHTVGRAATLSGSADLSEELVYAITKTIYESNDEMAKIHPQCRDFNLDTIKASAEADVIKAPIHPGARRYFEENGIVFSANIPNN
ncbi:MAG: TAXI family TRAP transporter solute-binding subunit [Eubacteriales bacterium]|nr:TAXI family TRAP transporter solute-binding subunit [Eubacteriales bacterium]